MPIPLELIVYVHGVSNDLRGRAHTREYEALHEGIAKRNAAWPSRFKGVEWGWNHDPGPARTHQLLTDAQRQLGARSMHAVMAPRDFTLNPARAVINGLRPLLVYGFSDIFYYTSADGKGSIRSAVGQQVCEYHHAETEGDAKVPISLTLLGHSAGSVVCFDLLFFLFHGDIHDFIDKDDPVHAELLKLRKMAQSGLLRLRRLITFGSPITMLACRSNPVLQILASGEELDPADYGLTSKWKDGPDLDGPRWINIWDRDDPIAWPVEPLMSDARGGELVEDVYVDVSDSVAQSHNAYWESKRVHRAIAERW